MEKRSEENKSGNIIKVAVTGPESTGKSLIAQQLAKHYNSVFVAEYAREYIDSLKRPYEFEDILKIAKGQLEREINLYAKANKIIFCDTELIVTKIWSEHAYKKCDEWILQNISKHPYDLYLLMDIDLHWEPDPQREHPQLRKYLFDLYFQELSARNLPFKIIFGEGKERLQNAIQAVELAMKSR